MPTKKCLIIGAGIAGIATAIRLAVKGYEVEVFEANAQAGGKLSEFNKDGFRFDAGPSLFTMPQYVDELFKLAGKHPGDYFQYQKLRVNCNYFYEDGTRIKAFASQRRLVHEIAKKTGESPDAIRKHMENSRKIYGITNPVFLQQSLHRLKTWFSFKTLWSLLQIFRIDAFRSMHKANKNFFKEGRMVQYFDRYATYNGSNPYRAPATLNVIPHLEQEFGAFFPVGGMYSITASLVDLAQSLGVKFHYNAPVQEIILNKNKASGLKVNDSIINADMIISNADVWFTYKKLLGNYPRLHPKKTLRQQRSSSALVFYWGINKRFESTGLHNVFFSDDYRKEFDYLWRKGTIYDAPTIYLHISSKQQTTDAPEGCENWFVMVNAPADNGQRWEQIISSTRQNILQKLSRHFEKDIGKLIISESVMDPRLIGQNTSSYKGSIYGSSSNNAMSAFVRHANRSRKISNMYFCGGSVHPGGGIPLALLSAKIVADWVG